MYRIVFICAGESTGSTENRFTGWTDVDLAEKGVGEARLAGQRLKRDGYEFDLAFAEAVVAGQGEAQG